MAKTQAGEGPRFVLFWGGVAAGKTTMRRRQCAEGFVHIDAAEIFAELSGNSAGAFPGEFKAELEAVGSRLAAEALAAKKDVAMEVIGDEPSLLESLCYGLHSIGYSVEGTCVTLPVEEALKRHRHAVETDPTYVSAFYTEVFHYQWVLAAIERLKKRRPSRRRRLSG